MDARAVQIPLLETETTVSALLLHPQPARALYVLAHGAGAGMNHPFLEAISQRLAKEGLATLRYQFPYMEAGRRFPNPPHLLQETVRSAVGAARELAPDLPLLAGGKSLGGRMTSQAQAQKPLPGVRGLVFLGFPLHAPGKPGMERAAHLADVRLPMLFLQGTRDALATTELIQRVCRNLKPRARLQFIEGGDHTFRVLKRSGRTEEEVLRELVAHIVTWAEEVPSAP